MDTDSTYRVVAGKMLLRAWIAAAAGNDAPGCPDFHHWTKRLCELPRGHGGPHCALVVWAAPSPAAGE
jgi:hypothetical protein